ELGAERPHDVALGEDAGEAAALHHERRPGLVLPHRGRGMGHGVARLHRDEVRAHDLADGRHRGNSLPPPPVGLPIVESRGALWEWFEPRRRAYPWRGTNDAYLVLVSEVMLQQTQASRVAPAFERFVARFPTVTALARAGRDEVLRTWGSLGYNRRAVALSEAARAIVRDHGGVVPAEPSDLARLRGVGPYTAAAVASIGHGLPVAAIDTNVRRVVARARLGREPGEAPAGELKRAADAWLDRDDPGGWNQALM